MWAFGPHEQAFSINIPSLERQINAVDKHNFKFPTYNLLKTGATVSEYYILQYSRYLKKYKVFDVE